MDDSEPKRPTVPGLHAVLEKMPDPSGAAGAVARAAFAGRAGSMAQIACTRSAGVGAKNKMGRGDAHRLEARRGRRAGAIATLPRRGRVELQQRPQPPRSGRHVTPVAALALRRNHAATNLARGEAPRGGEGPSRNRVAHFPIPHRDRLARVCPSSALPFSTHAGGTVAHRVRPLPVAHG